MQPFLPQPTASKTKISIHNKITKRLVQTVTVTFKLESVDEEAFIKTTEYLKTEGEKLGDMKIINSFGAFVDLSRREKRLQNRTKIWDFFHIFAH